MASLAVHLKKKTTVVLVLITLITSACSWRLMYNYLDWILPWYLDDYVTLTDQQEDLFDRATLRFLGWHRYVELPRYSQFFNALKNAQDAPMSEEQVLTFFDEAENLWTALIEKSIPDLLLLANQLSDVQVEQINTALKVKNEELNEKYGGRTESEQRQFWQKKMSDGLNDWLGNIDATQQQLIEQWSQTRRNTTANWLAYRNDWREKFIDILNDRNQPDFDEKMRSFLLQPRNIYSKAYLQAVTENRLSFAKLIAEISSTLTDEQRIYLQKELAQILIDLTDLSKLEG